MTPAAYTPRDPSTTVLYQVVADHLETFPSVGSDPPVGRLRSHSLTLLDGGFQRADGDGPYDYS